MLAETKVSSEKQTPGGKIWVLRRKVQRKQEKVSNKRFFAVSDKNISNNRREVWNFKLQWTDVAGIKSLGHCSLELQKRLELSFDLKNAL